MVHAGQVDAVSPVKSGLEYFCTPNDENLFGPVGCSLSYGFFHGMDRLHIFLSPIPVPGDHDALSAGKRFTDRLKGLPAHQDGHAPGLILEIFQIVWQVPGQLVVLSYDIIFRGRYKKGKYQVWFVLITNIKGNKPELLFRFLHGYRCLDRWMKLVVFQRKVLKPETEYILYLRVQFHYWQGIGLPA